MAHQNEDSDEDDLGFHTELDLTCENEHIEHYEQGYHDYLPPIMPRGWSVLYTDDGQPYYLEESTNTSTWVKPKHTAKYWQTTHIDRPQHVNPDRCRSASLWNFNHLMKTMKAFHDETTSNNHEGSLNALFHHSTQLQTLPAPPMQHTPNQTRTDSFTTPYGQDIVIEGFLLEKGTGRSCAFTKRWVVLYPNNHLAYYPQPENAKMQKDNPLGEISLYHVTTLNKKLNIEDQKYIFELVTLKRMFTFKAEDVDTYCSWIRRISPRVTPTVIYQGWGAKNLSHLPRVRGSSWKTRYLSLVKVLDEQTYYELRSYETDNKTKFKGVIDVADIDEVIVVHPAEAEKIFGEEHTFALELTTANRVHVISFKKWVLWSEWEDELRRIKQRITSSRSTTNTPSLPVTSGFFTPLNITCGVDADEFPVLTAKHVQCTGDTYPNDDVCDRPEQSHVMEDTEGSEQWALETLAQNLSLQKRLNDVETLAQNLEIAMDKTKCDQKQKHGLTFSAPQHIHIACNDSNQRTPTPPPLDVDEKTEKEESIGSLPAGGTKYCMITEEELTECIDSMDIDVNVLMDVVYTMDGMSQCSNRTDSNYDAAFLHNGASNGGSAWQSTNHSNQNNHNSDDSKENDDKDDTKYDPDEPDHASSHGCNHLGECSSFQGRECAECVCICTRKCETIKLLMALLNRLQQQHDYDSSIQNMLCKVIINKFKSKPIFKPMVTISSTESKTKHDLYPSYRAKNNVKVSRRLTQNIIPSTIRQSISNGYAFVEKSIGMQYNDGQIQHDPNTKCQIINVDCYDKSNEPLYCIMQRIPSTHNDTYKWEIIDQLYTATEATQLSDAHLPRSSRDQLQRISAQYNPKQFTFNSQSIRRVIKQCKWNTIPVFKEAENKQRLTLSITQEQLNPMITRSMKNIKNDATRFIPILMFDNASNTHWIEHILVVHVAKDIDIGISLRYSATYDVQITGIHLDKTMILEQHEVLLSHSQYDEEDCHCLDGFTSIINDLSVGNCDKLLNDMKNYKQRYSNFKILAHKVINCQGAEQLEILQHHAEMLIRHDHGSLGYNLFSDGTPPSIHSRSASSRSFSSSSLNYGLRSPDVSVSSDNPWINPPGYPPPPNAFGMSQHPPITNNPPLPPTQQFDLSTQSQQASQPAMSQSQDNNQRTSGPKRNYNGWPHVQYIFPLLQRVRYSIDRH